MINEFSLSVATVNGSGSQSANTILAKTLFRMGIPVGAKNLFPSNIAGLPTWFTIRANPHGYIGRKSLHDIVVAKNADTAEKDLQTVRSGGFYFYDQEFKFHPQDIRADVECVGIPYREIVQSASDSVKMRRMLTNMVYVGFLAELLKIPQALLKSVVESQFNEKANVVDVNFKAIELGEKFAHEKLLQLNFPFTAQEVADGVSGKMLIDGNSAAALGAVVGGCTFFSWYPITPSSSVAESFQEYCELFRKAESGERRYALVQAEDELSAINMVVGAGWAGSRAMTATSGPGLSLMAEAAGLSYFAEIPAVIWDVQRAGPSTGLPTRTMQGDLLFAYQLSHGDTQHIVLLPSHPEECYEFAQIALELSEKVQTLVIVLTDLDLGMNLWVSHEFELPNRPYDRGKVLSADDLNKVDEFARYRDIDGDGVGYRTLPGTPHVKAAYFTRGTGHTEKSTYSEDGPTYKRLLDRLQTKILNARKWLPQPEVLKSTNKAHAGLIAYGSTNFVISEVRATLDAQGISTDYLRIRALPLHESIYDFLASHDHVYIVEQNRDAQMRQLLTQKFPGEAYKFRSILSYDGLPVAPDNVVAEIQNDRSPNT